MFKWHVQVAIICITDFRITQDVSKWKYIQGKKDRPQEWTLGRPQDKVAKDCTALKGGYQRGGGKGCTLGWEKKSAEAPYGLHSNQDVFNFLMLFFNYY